METYAKALLYAIPFFIVLLFVEILYGYFIKNQKYTVMDTVASISSGFTNILKDSLGLGIVLVTYPYLLKHLALLELNATWLVWLVAFITIDFAGYWNHRLNHKINIFWNQHVIHHSSEEFNLACALRQPVSNLIGYFSLLLIPAALLGVPNKVIALLAPIHLFAQFWYHTQHIGKLGYLEYLIITPSQHRVHHAINSEYIDKNLGQILSIWDRIFGTFQEELDDVPPQYGVLKPAATWNPVLINFQHFWRIVKDAWRTNSYWDKVRIWFMPTGWRPADVVEKFPIEIIKDVYDFERYKTPSSKALNGYVIFQLVVTLGALMCLFYNYATIDFNNRLIIGAFIFIGIYGYTTLMDRSRYAAVIEVVRGVLGILFILFFKVGNELNEILSFASLLLISYFLVTIFAAIYFTFFENNIVKNAKID